MVLFPNVIMIWTISSDPPTQLDDNLVYTTIFKAVLLVETTDLDFWKNQITMIISLQFVSPINLIMGADRLHEDNLKYYYFLKVQKPVLEFFLDYGGMTFFGCIFIIKFIRHSSEKRGLCLMKFFFKTLKDVLV